jgi:hypothetical protein
MITAFMLVTIVLVYKAAFNIIICMFCASMIGLWTALFDDNYATNKLFYHVGYLAILSVSRLHHVWVRMIHELSWIWKDLKEEVLA